MKAETKKLEEQLAAAESGLARARTDLEQVGAALTAEDERLAKVLNEAETAAKLLVTIDPFAAKDYISARNEADVKRAQVEALQKRRGSAEAAVRVAEEAVAAAELKRDQVQLEVLKAKVADSDTRLETRLRAIRPEFLELVKEHLSLHKSAEQLARSVHERNPEISEDVRSKWDRRNFEGADFVGDLAGYGVLGCVEAAVDCADLAAWRAAQPPSHYELAVQQQRKLEAENRERLLMRNVEARQEELREQEEARLAYQRRMNSGPSAIASATRMRERHIGDGADRPRGDYTPRVG